MIEIKICTKCKKELPFTTENFHRNKNARSGLKNECKNCTNERGRDYRRNNKEKMKDLNLRRRFNITLEEYNELLEKQNSVCAICNGDNNKKTLVVDHDHNTNKIRGLLCDNCNTGLGLFKESRWALNKAIQYLVS